MMPDAREIAGHVDVDRTAAGPARRCGAGCGL